MIHSLTEKSPQDFGSTDEIRDEFADLIGRCQEGCVDAQSELASHVHADFYRIARRLCAGQGFEHSLHATNLVNETFLRLLKGRVFQDPNSGAYLFAAAGKMMRNVIADYLRSKNRVKRTPVGKRVYLDWLIDQFEDPAQSFDDLNEAIELLEKVSPRRASIVNMRFFWGMTVDETAHSLAVSVSTVEREWREARRWLYRQLV